MRNRGQLLFGSFLLLLGLILLLSNLFEINVWKVCWPVGVILFGVWLIFRPRLAPGINLQLFADVKRMGSWQVADEEIWLFVGDVDLDLTRAEIPIGETKIRITGFVGDVDIFLPAGVGLSITSNAFFMEYTLFGKRHQIFLAPVMHASEDYQTSERKLNLETTFFVGDLDIRRVPAP